MKYGELRLGAQVLRQASGSRPRVMAEVMELHLRLRPRSRHRALVGHRVLMLDGEVERFIRKAIAARYLAEMPQGLYLIRPDQVVAGRWLAAAASHPGSWWRHWSGWLAQFGDARVAARETLGRDAYREIEPAPGRYVKERCSPIAQ